MTNQKDLRLRRLVLLGMFSALALVLTLVGRIPIVLWLKYDPKDIAVVFGGLLFGPLASAAVSVVVSVVEMFTLSDTGIWGFVMNVLSSCSFACVAAWVYRRRRTLSGAVAGLVAGAVMMAAAMLLFNYLITPLYMHVPRAEVAPLLIPVFLPFNLFKGTLNAALTLLLYKPLTGALRRARLLPPADAAAQKAPVLGVLAIVAALAVACLALLAVMGVLL